MEKIFKVNGFFNEDGEELEELISYFITYLLEENKTL